jgi:hypothetical protein
LFSLFFWSLAQASAHKPWWTRGHTCWENIDYSTHLATLQAFLPKLSKQEMVDLTVKFETGGEFSRRDRLLVAMLRLAFEKPAAQSGVEAFQQIADVFRTVEMDYLPDSVVQLWQTEKGHGKGREALIEEAFIAYDCNSPTSSYDENEHPKAFSMLLKPPAHRYNRSQVIEGKDIISQLDHITIVDRLTGAMEIQAIDPELRTRLNGPTDPLILAILDDPDYFEQLPNKSQLVIFRKPGRDGKTVWQ